MTETTTIQVRRDQAERLKEIRRENGNYKTALDELLEAYDGSSTDEVDYAEIERRCERAVESALPKR